MAEMSPEQKRREEAKIELLRQIWQRPTPASQTLLWIIIGLWLGGFVYGNFIGISSSAINNEQLAFQTGMKVNRLIASGEWWRIITSQFVHLNILHIFFNGYGLYAFGQIVERFYGPRRFFLLYWLSGTIGGVASYLLVNLPSGGASGAVYGLVGVVIAMGWRYRDYLPKQLASKFTRGLIPWVVVGIGIGFFESVPMDNAAHIGGLVTGFVGSLVFSAVFDRNNSDSTNEWIIAGLFWIAVFLLFFSAALWAFELIECTGSKEAYRQCYPELIEQIRQYSP